MIQVRVANAKGEPDLVDGPDDAPIVVRLARGDLELEPAVAFMQGKLKVEGPVGEFFDSLKSGSMSERLTAMRERV